MSAPLGAKDPEAPEPEAPEPEPPPSEALRTVLWLLCALAVIGSVASFATGLRLGIPVALDLGISLELSVGILALAIQKTWRRPPAEPQREAEGASAGEELADLPAAVAAQITELREEAELRKKAGPSPGLVPAPEAAAHEPAATPEPELAPGAAVRPQYALLTAPLFAAFATIATILVLYLGKPDSRPGLVATVLTAGAFLVAAAIAGITARYLAAIPAERLALARALSRAARVQAWLLVAGAVATGLHYAAQQEALDAIRFAVVSINLVIAGGLLAMNWDQDGRVVDLDLFVFELLGSRMNLLASIFDCAQNRLGIDLRSTWALSTARRSLEPLFLGILLVGWLSTGLTVVDTRERALLERFGKKEGEPRQPGLHLHWPWPIDRVVRFDASLAFSLPVGHEAEAEAEAEGAEPEGPENVLWAEQHEGQEYTLLLGDGRDLIAIDAAVHYKIRDVAAWRYSLQNPQDALRASAYRAVMFSTLDRTLEDALSENVRHSTERMLAMVQTDADALGLGVDVLSFTVAGMHPPVAVAEDYQAVVSAGLRSVSQTVEARAYRARALPEARGESLEATGAARSQALGALAQATGEAYAFRQLLAAQRVSPVAFRFRKRLETLEKGLPGRSYAVVDRHFLQDGGEIWLMP